MSKNLEKVVQRAISDAGFRRLLQSNPDAALRDFKLTTDEVAALKSGDATRLMSFGVDQRMSKTFSFSDVTMAHQSLTTDLTSGTPSASLTEPNSAGATHGAVIDEDTSGATRGAVIDQDTSGASRLIIPNASGSLNAIDPGQVDGRVGAIIGDPSSSSASDELEDQSHAFAARTGVDGETVRSSVRDVEPTLLGANSASDAVEDTSHAFAAGRSSDVEAAVRSSVHDVEPATLQGSGLVAPIEGSPESFAFSEPEAIRSSVRDVGPATLQGSGLVAPIEGSPESFSFSEPEAIRSSVRDVEPTLLGANSASDAVEDTSHAFSATAGIEGETVRSSVRDVEPTLLGANSASDAVEDTSHAFLAQQDASRYAAESGIDPGVATDEGQVFTPGAETLTDVHSDTVGSAGSSQEPDLSA